MSTPQACPDCYDMFPNEDHRCPPTIKIGADLNRHDNNTDFWLYAQCKGCHRTVMINYTTIVGGTFVCPWCHE